MVKDQRQTLEVEARSTKAKRQNQYRKQDERLQNDSEDFFGCVNHDEGCWGRLGNYMMEVHCKVKMSFDLEITGEVRRQSAEWSMVGVWRMN